MASSLRRKDFLLLLLYARGPTGQICEPIRGKTRLAKLLFLLKSEGWVRRGLGKLATEYYDFKPDNYGPFDAEVFRDLDFFRSIDFVEIRNLGPLPGDEINEYLEALREWSLDNDLAEEELVALEERFCELEVALAGPGVSFVEERLLPRLEDKKQIGGFEFVKQTYGGWSLSKLLRYIYSTYPEMTTRSRIRRQVLGPAGG